MKKVRLYSCDGGCLLIGNGSARFNIPNGYGDGKHRVIVTFEMFYTETMNRAFKRMGVELVFEYPFMEEFE